MTNKPFYCPHQDIVVSDCEACFERRVQEKIQRGLRRMLRIAQEALCKGDFRANKVADRIENLLKQKRRKNARK